MILIFKIWICIQYPSARFSIATESLTKSAEKTRRCFVLFTSRNYKFIYLSWENHWLRLYLQQFLQWIKKHSQGFTLYLLLYNKPLESVKFLEMEPALFSATHIYSPSEVDSVVFILSLYIEIYVHLVTPYQCGFIDKIKCIKYVYIIL